MFAVPVCVFEPSILRVHVREVPFDTTWPLVVAPKLNVLVHVLAPPEQADDVVFVLPSELPFSSTRVTPSKNAVAEGAVPLKVTITLFTARSPALSDVKVRLAKLSAGDFARLVVFPRTAAANVSLVRRTVMKLPLADESVTAEVAFEVLPRATTDSGTVSFAVSVEVAILKECVVLSLIPLAEYEATSPLSVRRREPDFGTTTGVEKWNGQ